MENNQEDAERTLFQLIEENEQLKDKIAVAHFPECEQREVAKTIAMLRSEIKSLEAREAELVKSRNQAMHENAKLMQQLASQRREIKKLSAESDD